MNHLAISSAGVPAMHGATSACRSLPEPFDAPEALAALDDCEGLLQTAERLLGTCVSVPTAGLSERRMLAVVRECLQVLAPMRAALALQRARQMQTIALAGQLQARLEHALAELIDTRHERGKALHRSLHDGLTTLPNRDCFRQRLENALGGGPRDALPLAVLYIDLDGMKAVNDTHGHGVGDRVLALVATRLQRAVRQEVDLVSRQGGDEFALLLANLPGRGSVAQVAAKLFDTLAAPLQVGSLEIGITASIGIALSPADGGSAEELLQNADAAMYRAKRQRSRFAFFDQPEGGIAGLDGD